MTSKLTVSDEYLEQLATNRVYPLDMGYIRIGDDLMSIVRELQERRKSETDSEPVANAQLPISRERLAKIISWRGQYGENANVMLPAEEAAQLAAFALSVIDAQPVAWRYRTTDINGNPNPDWSFSETEDLLGLYQPLYRHVQPAPKTEREPIAWLNDAYLARGVVDGEAGSEDAGPGYIPVYREAGPQPAPVVPVITFYRDGIEAAAKWIDQQREAYDSEHGWSDPDTGAFEFGNDAQRDYSSTLAELAEGIRALHPNAGNSPVIPDGSIQGEKPPADPCEKCVDVDGARGGCTPCAFRKSGGR